MIALDCNGKKFAIDDLFVVVQTDHVVDGMVQGTVEGFAAVNCLPRVVWTYNGDITWSIPDSLMKISPEDGETSDVVHCRGLVIS